MLSNLPGAVRVGSNVIELDELQNADPGLNHIRKSRNWLFFESLGMQISKHAYICRRCLFPTIHLIFLNALNCHILQRKI